MKPVTEALREMAEAFEGRNVSLPRIAVYAERLADLPEAEVVAAINRLINTSRFFPTIAEIREAAVAGQETEGLSELAWTEVLGEAARVGYNRGPQFRNGQFYEPEKPVFTSAITEQAVRSVGWREICLTEDPTEKTFLRNQFLKTWDALASRALKQAQNGEAPDVVAIGSRCGEPVAIGEATRKKWKA